MSARRAETASTQITPDNDAIVSEIFIAAPRERVFTALIDREQALQWGSSSEFVMASGRWMRVSEASGCLWLSSKTPAGKYANADLVHHGEILEFDLPRVLEYTWFASWHSDPSQRTVVRWELLPFLAGRRLRSRIAGWRQCQKIARAMLKAGRAWW